MNRIPYQFRRFWWVLTLTTLAFALVGYLLASQIVPSYTSTATLLLHVMSFEEAAIRMVSEQPNIVEERSATGMTSTTRSQPRLNEERTTAIIKEDPRQTAQRLLTYAELIKTPPVIDEVVTQLGGTVRASTIVDSLNVDAATEALLIRITAVSEDREKAALIANATAEAFVAQSASRPNIVLPTSMSIAEHAQPAAGPGSSSIPLRTAFAALAGLAFGTIVVLGKTYFDNSIWDEGELLDQAFTQNIPLLGVIPDGSMGRNRIASGITAPQVTGPIREIAIKTLDSPYLRAKSESSEIKPSVVIVSSANRFEGRTSITSRLGPALLLEGHVVTLVDLDGENPALHVPFGLTNTMGICDWLASDEAHRSNYRAYDVGLDGLKVIPCGDPTKIQLAEVKITELKSALNSLVANSSDIILVDTPAMENSTEALILKRIIDGVIIVVQAKRTTTDQVARLVARLKSSGIPIVGLVLNRG